MLEESNLPVAYYQFDADAGTPPDPPFLVFYFPGSRDFMADGVNYVPIRALTVELYTDNKDFAAEARIETLFRAHGLKFQRTEAYIEKERMYQITYTMEVLLTNESEVRPE